MDNQVLNGANASTRCPPLNLSFLYKLYKQRRISEAQNDTTGSSRGEKSQVLQTQGFPVGLADIILDHSEDHPVRIWLIANGGTMHQNDGHIVNQTTDGKVETVDCSRWQEVTSTLRWHAELAAWCQNPMAIRFLHDPGVQAGPQQLGVSASKHLSSSEEIIRLNTVLQKSRPTGGTSPVLEHLQDVLSSILSVLPILQSKQKTLVVCLCTDSIPTNSSGIEDTEIIEDFCQTLCHLLELPVRVTIRLSTDEERVVHFYQNLIGRFGLKDIQVLDDYVSECKMVHEHNPWLHYGYPLHLCREEGIQNPTLEKLSQQALTAEEMLYVIRTIFGQRNPQDQLTYINFRKQVEKWNNDTGLMWNPIKKKFVPWIDLKRMDRCCKDGNGDKCNIM